MRHSYQGSAGQERIDTPVNIVTGDKDVLDFLFHPGVSAFAFQVFWGVGGGLGWGCEGVILEEEEDEDRDQDEKERGGVGKRRRRMGGCVGTYAGSILGPNLGRAATRGVQRS